MARPAPFWRIPNTVRGHIGSSTEDDAHNCPMGPGDPCYCTGTIEVYDCFPENPSFQVTQYVASNAVGNQ
eukprot:971303-Pyramimonas_sp.AAC.1